MRRIISALTACIVTTACGAELLSQAPAQRQASTASQSVYQPLAVGDTWKYVCNHQFTIRNVVIGMARVGKTLTYEFSIQIPSSPTKSVKVVQLLANDRTGTTRIYGYLRFGKAHPVTPAVIVVPSPVLDKHYDYPSPLERQEVA